MTVSYSCEVANASSFGCFWRILLKWKGSVYKLIYRELLVYLSFYYAINLAYRHVMNTEQKETFQRVRKYFGEQTESIPMSFVLGFYVTLIVKRWWEQYRLLPWPDSMALFVSAAIPGQEERGRLMRRNIVRYSMLSYVITLQHVSLRVKQRFPTWQHMVDAGLMMESEKKIFDLMDEKTTMAKYWMPLVWATNIINRARKENMIQSDHVVQTMLQELSDIRRRLGSLIGYDTVCVPLVYTQVVTLSLYTYFLSALLGRQCLDSDIIDLYFPIFLMFQFCFYIGWLKVAEVLINPFGEDDDDIELNWLIDRHIKAGYMIVDEMHEEHPELLKDQYWEEVVPRDLPYTVASEHYRRDEPKGSAQLYRVKESDAVYANMLPSSTKANHEDVYADYESVDTPLVERRKNWFQRQLHRMGSSRSSSTAYSSGLFRGGGGGRVRNTSISTNIYSTTNETGPTHLAVPSAMPSQAHKLSFYDRILNRKSGRGQINRAIGRQGTTKLNGSAIPPSLKNRPRIPTPDVTREMIDGHRNSIYPTAPPISPPISPTPLDKDYLQESASQEVDHNNITSRPFTPTSEMPAVVQVLLPIKEQDVPVVVATSAKGVNTQQLAKAVFNNVSLPVQLNHLTLSPAQLAVMASLPANMSCEPDLKEGVRITELDPSGEITDRKSSVSSTSSGNNNSNHTKRGEVYV
ncbi:bestrophin-4 [Neocloeon triangulifer]|uniref:bestrophin-4 n=1 Tax=Neocloeon triangulifer TaxID=2078957 RepID=UPI00286F2F3A|nr:bestrophin-4 [Neocloeon triangulifer]